MTDYYLDSVGGNDANTGLSDAQAWQSFAQLHTQTLEPGDNVWLKRGSTWNVQLKVLHDGEPGKPITYGAYDTGDPPDITGEVGQNYCIAGRGHNSIVVQDIAVNTAVATGISSEGGSDWVIQRCFARNCPSYGLNLGSCAVGKIIDSFVRDCGIGLGGSNMFDVLLQNNIITDNNIVTNADGINAANGERIRIIGNDITGSNVGGSADGIQVAGGRDVLIEGNSISDCSNAGIILTTSVERSYGRILRNHIRGARLGIAIQIDEGHTLIEGNTVFNNQDSCMHLSILENDATFEIKDNQFWQNNAAGACYTQFNAQQAAELEAKNVCVERWY